MTSPKASTPAAPPLPAVRPKRSGLRTATRAVQAALLIWLLIHVAQVFVAPGHLGQPPAWLGVSTLPVPLQRGLRALLLLALTWQALALMRQRLRLGGDLGRIWRVAAAGSVGFVVLHLWHLRRNLWSASDGYIRAAESAEALAAGLSSTYWGIPWLALGYLAGSISTGLLAASEAWLWSTRARPEAGWRSRRNALFACAGVGTLLTLMLLRALVYYATGDDPLR